MKEEEEQEKNLVALRDALRSKNRIILMMPETLPALQDSFNMGRVMKEPLPLIANRNNSSFKTTKTKWCITQTEKWDEFQDKLDEVIKKIKDKTYPIGHFHIGHGEHFYVFPHVYMPPTSKPKERQQKKDDILVDLLRSRSKNADEIMGFPVLQREKEGSAWDVCVPVANRKTKSLYFINVTGESQLNLGFEKPVQEEPSCVLT
ncbi:MAG: hypothetical protein OEY94_09645 [Alphaproteobacteria bacterium]|nr:hypothetical protein [Alphaproteobacteria bacterium]